MNQGANGRRTQDLSTLKKTVAQFFPKVMGAMGIDDDFVNLADKASLGLNNTVTARCLVSGKHTDELRDLPAYAPRLIIGNQAHRET
jgi:hypothetical protein